MDQPKILVTCPPMLGLKEQFIPIIERAGFKAVCPNVEQTLSEEELIELVPQCVGWIIGDDPATRKVFEAGVAGKLRAAVKWGIGVDNVDFNACEALNIPITNTPGMFGEEVADLAINYLLSLARETHFIDRGIRDGNWPKNRGVSVSGKTAGLIGYGDIGQQTAKRAVAFGLNVVVYDPSVSEVPSNMKLRQWPDQIIDCDFIIFTCSLNRANKHMLDSTVFEQCKSGVRIINVARGPLINEAHLEVALESGKVHSAALDVFEREPLPLSSYLRKHPLCVLGSHNGSNTQEAVTKTNVTALRKLFEYLGP